MGVVVVRHHHEPVVEGEDTAVVVAHTQHPSPLPPLHNHNNNNNNNSNRATQAQVVHASARTTNDLLGRDARRFVKPDTEAGTHPASLDASPQTPTFSPQVARRIAQLQTQHPCDRLCRSWWAEHASPWHVRVLDSGYRPPLHPGIQVRHLTSPLRTSRNDPHLGEVLKDMLRKGAIVETTPSQLRGSFSVRTVPKKSGGHRLVSNLRRVNKFVQCDRFRMDDLSDVSFLLSSSASRGSPLSWASTIDIADAFLHIPLDPSLIPYLGFGASGRWYAPTSLPFGLSTSPVVWERFVGVVVRHLRAMGLQVANHVDDLIILSPSRAQCVADTERALNTLLDAGILPHAHKSRPTPAQRVEYLGFELDLSDPLHPFYAVPTAKRRQVRQDTARLANTTGPVTPRRVARVLGKLRALQPALPEICLLTLPLSKGLAAMLNSSYLHPWDCPTTLPESARLNLLELRTLLSSQVETPVQLPSSPHLFRLATDASDWRWGAVTPTEEFGGYFSPEEQKLHITAKETLALLHALRSLSLPPNTHVHLSVDSQPLYHALRRLRTRSFALQPLLLQIHQHCLRHALHLTPHWVPSEENPADRPSRAPRDWDDYQIAPAHLNTALRSLSLPHPTIDLMAYGPTGRANGS